MNYKISKKGNDSISLYLQRIKEARDYLSAAAVKFDDDDIVILTLNGLPAEFNIIRSIIRGRENVISLKDLRSQLLAEEAMLANISATPFMSAMVARDTDTQFNDKWSKFGTNSNSGDHCSGFSDGNSSGYNFSGYRPFYNKNKGKEKFQYGSNSKFVNGKQFYNNSNRGVLDSSPMLCSTCLEGKFSKLPFASALSKSNKPFEIVHSNVWGPAPCLSIEGFKYYVTFIYECTRYCWIFPINNKAVVCSIFVAFYQFVLNQFSISIKTLQSDGGGEYIGKQFQSFLVQKGITHQMSYPHTPEQNGLAGRKYRHIIETSITLLHQAQLPPSLWSFACQTLVYQINRMPTQTLNHKSPFEVLYGFVPEVNHLRIFGCSCYPLFRPFNSIKLQPRTSKCVFLGYASKYKGFICYEVSRKKVFISQHVIFDEREFPYSSLASTQTIASVKTTTYISANTYSKS